jgi:hypothetical protein
VAGLAPLVRASKDDFDGGKNPSAGSGGSRGIAGGRDRVRKSFYAAAESRLGRGGSLPGMRAALIGDNGLK